MCQAPIPASFMWLMSCHGVGGEEEKEAEDELIEILLSLRPLNRLFRPLSSLSPSLPYQTCISCIKLPTHLQGDAEPSPIALSIPILDLSVHQEWPHEVRWSMTNLRQDFFGTHPHASLDPGFEPSRLLAVFWVFLSLRSRNCIYRCM